MELCHWSQVVISLKKLNDGLLKRLIKEDMRMETRLEVPMHKMVLGGAEMENSRYMPKLS